MLAVIVAVALIMSLGVSWPTPRPAQIHQDTDCDLQPETFALNRDGRLLVEEAGIVLWESPSDWTITQIAVADITGDGKQELLMVLWNYGSFGTSRPWWIKGPDRVYSNHLFIYQLVGGRVKPLWCSSALERPIIEMELQDVNGDGQIDLRVLEGPKAGNLYPLRQVFLRSYSTWQWQGWGFSKI